MLNVRRTPTLGTLKSVGSTDHGGAATEGIGNDAIVDEAGGDTAAAQNNAGIVKAAAAVPST